MSNNVKHEFYWSSSHIIAGEEYCFLFMDPESGGRNAHHSKGAQKAEPI